MKKNYPDAYRNNNPHRKNNFNSSINQNKKDFNKETITNEKINENKKISQKEKDSRQQRRKKYEQRKKRDRIIVSISLVIFLVAICLIAWKPVKNLLRNNKTNEILNQIEEESEETFVVNPNVLSIEGEEYEALEELEESEETSESEEPDATLPDEVVLTALGTIKIADIELNLPLLDGADKTELKYGAGRYEGTADPGEEGNCVILGHRMKAYGSLFNRLGEIEIGDEIVINTVDGDSYTYVVDEIIPELDPEDLFDYISIDSGTGKQITLVTCTPTGVGSHRLIIIGHLDE